MNCPFMAACVLLALQLTASAAELTSSVTSTNSPRPGSTNAPRPFVVSPELQPDRSVIFRLFAPNVTNVTVSGEWGGSAKSLSMETNGVWSGTVGPLAPGVFGYSFTVDGVQMVDPGNTDAKPMRSWRTSVLEVPADQLAIYDFDPAIAHGTVRQHTYFSRALKRQRSLHVYTPPGYDQKRFTKYPVLYLFHGNGDNDATWTSFGRAGFILDNLIAQKRAKPMVIVMTDGHALPPRPPSGGGPNIELFLKGIQAFESDLIGDVMPLVESNYRLRTGAENRAIAGLSMGGGQSLVIGLNHLSTFGWVAGFSSFIPKPEETVAMALSNPGDTNKRLKLLWIACGKDDSLVDRNKEMDAVLGKCGIHRVFKITDGNHSWPVWRGYLAELAPQLF